MWDGLCCYTFPTCWSSPQLSLGNFSPFICLSDPKMNLAWVIKPINLYFHDLQGYKKLDIKTELQSETLSRLTSISLWCQKRILRRSPQQQSAALFLNRYSQWLIGKGWTVPSLFLQYCLWFPPKGSTSALNCIHKCLTRLNPDDKKNKRETKYGELISENVIILIH